MSIYSLKDFKYFSEAYNKVMGMRFEKKCGILIANENTNEEFLVISEWNYKINPSINLQFDIWTLIDLHKLFWIFKFRNKLNKMGLIKYYLV